MSATWRNRRILPSGTRFNRKRGHPDRAVGKHKGALIAIILPIVCLSGCDDANIRADDPAMWNHTATRAAESTETMAPSANEVMTENEPSVAEAPRIPKRQYGRVFIPDLGWLDETAFWAMYDNEPEKLPDTLDFYAVHLLREEYERERETQGES